MCDIESTSRKPFLHPSACWPQQLLHTYTRGIAMDRVRKEGVCCLELQLQFCKKSDNLVFLYTDSRFPIIAKLSKLQGLDAFKIPFCMKVRKRQI